MSYMILKAKSQKPTLYLGRRRSLLVLFLDIVMMEERINVGIVVVFWMRLSWRWRRFVLIEKKRIQEEGEDRRVYVEILRWEGARS